MSGHRPQGQRISGCLNVIADRLSWPNQPISPHPEIVTRIFRTYGTPTVDMFATVHNAQLPQFMSQIPEPRTLAIDAMSQDWQGRSLYMFPPFPLLNKVIQKLHATQDCKIILIAPWWSSQPWFPHLLRLCGPPSHHSIPLRHTCTVKTGVCLGRHRRIGLPTVPDFVLSSEDIYTLYL